MSNEKSSPSRGHGPNEFEKPKNLSLALKNLYKYLTGFKKYILIALILASLSSVFSIIGPNKISDLTDYISKGLIVNKDAINKITDSITADLNQDNISNVSNEILNIDYEDIIKLSSSEDKLAISEFIQSNNIKSLLKLSDESKEKIFKDSTINGVYISSKDKIDFVNKISSLNNTDKKQISSVIMDMPKSILTLMCSDSIINDILITKENKAEFITLIKI